VEALQSIDFDNPVHVACMKRVSQHAALIFEVITMMAGQGMMSSYDHIINALVKDKGTALAITGRRNFIHLFVSAEKARMKKQLEARVILITNDAPLTLDEAELRTFVATLKTCVAEKRQAAWAEAAILVELATGARTTEILFFSQFHPDGNLIVQEGVLKKKTEGKSDMTIRMDPRPVIFTMTPAFVQEMVYDVIRPALHALLIGLPTEPSHANFYNYHLQTFNQFNAPINNTINAHYPNAAQYTPRLTSHSFRKVYANWSYDMHGHKPMSRNAWIAKVLGHNPSTLSTSLSYTGARFIRSNNVDITKMKKEIMTELKVWMNEKFITMAQEADSFSAMIADDTRSRLISQQNQ
jgi:hypothetical protein